VAVLMPLYEQMKDTPVPVDLGSLWKQLGLEMHGRDTRFNNHAPLAATRVAIAAGATHRAIASVVPDSSCFAKLLKVRPVASAESDSMLPVVVGEQLRKLPF
jgi:hypothetical protein